MDWLLQNWIWVVVGIGVAYYLLRGRLRGHGAGHGGLIGMGHRGHAGSGDHGAHGDQSDSHPTANATEAAVDPVGREAVRTDKALTSIYRANVYYFASKENRDRFEAAPQQYAQNAAGHPVGPAGASDHQPRKRHGC